MYSICTIRCQAIIDDLECSKPADKSNQEALIRKLMRRKSKRETKAIWSEIRNGVLRRSNSEEEISTNECGDKNQVSTSQETSVSRGQRVRHSSDGHYDDVNTSGLCQVTCPVATGAGDDETGTDNVYENVTFFQGSAKFGDKRKNNAIEMNSSYHNYNSDIHKFISHHSSR